MSETLRELFGTPEELKPEPVPVPVAAPIVVEAPQLSLREQRLGILKNKSTAMREKIKALLALRNAH